jgi:hypothetical protein
MGCWIVFQFVIPCFFLSCAILLHLRIRVIKKKSFFCGVLSNRYLAQMGRLCHLQKLLFWSYQVHVSVLTVVCMETVGVVFGDSAFYGQLLLCSSGKSCSALTSSDMHKSEATVITVVLQVTPLALTSSPAFVSCFSALLLASDTMRPFHDPLKHVKLECMGIGYYQNSVQ